MNTVLLIIGQPSMEKGVWSKTFEFCRDEVQKLLEAIPAAIQVAINTWLIDIEKDLSRLSQVVLACHESHIPYVAEKPDTGLVVVLCLNREYLSTHRQLDFKVLRCWNWLFPNLQHYILPED